MKIDKVLKYSLLISLILLIGSAIWLILNNLKIFSLFPTISFLALVSYTLFVIRLYLSNLQHSKLKLIHWIVVSIISLPVVVGLFQFLDSRFYENYWPVIITLISVQSVIGLMSVFGFFVTRKNTPTIVNVMVLFTGFYCVIWSFLVLTKSVINEVKQISLYVLIGLTAIILLGNLFVMFRKGN